MTSRTDTLEWRIWKSRHLKAGREWFNDVHACDCCRKREPQMEKVDWLVDAAVLKLHSRRCTCLEFHPTKVIVCRLWYCLPYFHSFHIFIAFLSPKPFLAVLEQCMQRLLHAGFVTASMNIDGSGSFARLLLSATSGMSYLHLAITCCKR